MRKNRSSQIQSNLIENARLAVTDILQKFVSSQSLFDTIFGKYIFYLNLT